MAGLAALQYAAEAFDPTIGKLMGRQVAGQEFLKAWVRHADADPITSWTANDRQHQAFAAQVRACGGTAPIAAAGLTDLDPLISAGALWLADPSVSRFAWERRWRRQTDWSVVGITHTMCTHAAMTRIVEMLRAPIQPWDALICTSHAVKQVVTTVLRAEAEYLNVRMGATRFGLPHLPVIPLGIDTAALSRDAAARAAWRAELGLDERDVAVLQFGRLSVNGKMHPTPLYLALAEAGRHTGRPIHLILAGKFVNPLQERGFRALAADAAPGIVTHFVDGERPDIAGVRSAADIGVLLSDNIQESFGLAPVELMAAGLPVVAADWDGLKDTVEQNVTGIRVDTRVPPAGVGELLARRYATVDSYDAFLGGVVQSTVVDVRQAAAAFVALIRDPERRAAMGAAGRRRARTLFDWSVVIGAYRDLLTELAAIRTREQEQVPRTGMAPANPAQMDPFIAFAAHASGTFDEASTIAAHPNAPPRAGDVLGGRQMAMLNQATIPAEGDLDAMIALLREDGPQTVDTLCAQLPAVELGRAIAGVGWLLKFGYAVRHDAAGD